jgi:hypothetical protein
MTATRETTSSRYHNRFLFDYSKGEIDRCLGRLSDQAAIYGSHGPKVQRIMRTRALFVAALTLNATAVWTAMMVARGSFSMRTQVLFFRKRWRQGAGEWGENAKSCFARALSGYSIGQDGVCVDRHLERMGIAPADAAAQWSDWFRLYESLYGPGETVLCVRWHVELLDWIAIRGEKPMPWKGAGNVGKKLKKVKKVKKVEHVGLEIEGPRRPGTRSETGAEATGSQLQLLPLRPVPSGEGPAAPVELDLRLQVGACP